MKTLDSKLVGLLGILGVAAVAGYILAATSYRQLELRAVAEQAMVPTLARLCQDHQLSLVLKTLHEGKVDEAVQRLDMLRCWDIVGANAELASADSAARAWGEDVLTRIARARPDTAQVESDPVGVRAEAKRLLERALKADRTKTSLDAERQLR